MRNRIEELKKLSIEKEVSMLYAIKEMDKVDYKLLIVVDKGNFYSLISLGDIQRAIISNKKFDTPVKEILRKDIIVAFEDDSFESVKSKMLQYRTEFMPVIDKTRKIVDIYFWDDVFLHPFESEGEKLLLPVVIMAGGQGTRLKPITNILPKALVPIGDMPIIEIIINRFHAIGASEFFISVNYKAGLIINYFENSGPKSYKIQYIHEKMPSGTAGSLSLLAGKIHSTFFVSNCDIVIEQDYRDIYDYHKENGNEITIVASLKSYHIPYGIIKTGQNGNLIDIQEKPELTYMINTGMYVLEPGILSEVPHNIFFHITDLIKNVKNRGGKIGVFPVSEKSLLDIGDWQLYQKTFQNTKPKS